MLRVHFTSDDLARVRVAPGPDFLWEISNSVQTLQRRDGEREFGAWRRWARPRLSGSPRLLSRLLPPRGYSPDFLTPTTGDRSTLQASVDVLLSTPRRRLRAELERLAPPVRLPGWLGELVAATRTPCASWAEPCGRTSGRRWPRTGAGCTPTSTPTAPCGCAASSTAAPKRCWPGSGRSSAGGRPSSKRRTPSTRTCGCAAGASCSSPRSSAGPPRPRWPTGSCRPCSSTPSATPPTGAPPPGPPAPRPGRGPWDPSSATPAPAVLRATRTGCSTLEAARLLDVTHPAVSQHLNVLRAAGLVTTVRRAGRSFHVATAEGRALLAAEDPPAG